MDNNLAKMELEAQEMTALRYIKRDNAKFFRTEGGFVGVEYNGVRYDRVNVVRLFPFTDPDHYIGIRTPDENSKEIGVIEELSSMSSDVVEMLEEQLNLNYFTPQISKILSIKDEYGCAYFHVVTDKGECKFAINMGGNNITKLSDTRLLITDLDENRFEIRDVLKLSGKEQRKLDLFL